MCGPSPCWARPRSTRSSSPDHAHIPPEDTGEIVRRELSQTVLWLGESWKVSPSDEFLARIERLFAVAVLSAE
jgi:hypothetical protein